jgi:hypothetical protein
MVSIASRVVPGSSLTMVRWPPTAALKRLDLPALGRPTIATEIGASSSSGAVSPSCAGSVPKWATMSSNRSPTPRPCRAEMARASPTPSSKRSASAATARFGSSSLLPSSRSGTRARRRTSAISWSAGKGPFFASTTKSTRSASVSAVSTCARIGAAKGEPSSRSNPPVSTRSNHFPFHSTGTTLRSRVTPGISWTTVVRVAVSLLMSVDLPALGAPTTATTGRRRPSSGTGTCDRLGEPTPPIWSSLLCLRSLMVRAV